MCAAHLDTYSLPLRSSLFSLAFIQRPQRYQPPTCIPPLAGCLSVFQCHCLPPFVLCLLCLTLCLYACWHWFIFGEISVRRTVCPLRFYRIAIFVVPVGCTVVPPTNRHIHMRAEAFFSISLPVNWLLASVTDADYTCPRVRSVCFRPPITGVLEHWITLSPNINI